jgi:hypothetical protein
MENLRHKDQDASAMTAEVGDPAVGTGLRHPVEAVGRGSAPRRLVVILDGVE